MKEFLSGNRGFGYILVVVALVIASWASSLETKMVLVTVAGLVALTTVFRPQTLSPFLRAWIKLGESLQKIVNPVVLLLFYLTFFTLSGIALRIFRKNFFDLRWEPNRLSYWKEPAAAATTSMKDPF
ncbi:MAG: hypothetical protein ACK5Y2_10605 [Bdellovibrionales bacterium]